MPARKKTVRLIRLGDVRKLTRGVLLDGTIEFEHGWYRPMA